MVWGWIDFNVVELATKSGVERADVRPPEVSQAEALLERATADDPSWGCS
jgi:hypothetical protein